MIAESPPRGRMARTLRAGLALCLAGLAYAVGVSLRAGGPVRLAAVPVVYREAVVPACGEGSVATRGLTMITAYLARDVADDLASIAVSGEDGARRWTRSGGVCASGDEREPCPTEACREGICAVRLAVRGDGPFDMALFGRDGSRIGSGEVSVPEVEPPPPPRLDVERSGREVRLLGVPGSVARISAIRDGRVAADVPSVLDGGGRARFAVPQGTDAVRVSVSAGGEGGVAQAGALLPKPFDGSCP